LIGFIKEDGCGWWLLGCIIKNCGNLFKNNVFNTKPKNSFIMKKIYFILFVILLHGNAIGQVWIDSGAVWHYDFKGLGFWGFQKYEYTKDTLIQNHNCQKINDEIYVFEKNQFHNTVLLSHRYYPAQFTYVSGDTVFYFTNDEFFVLYNFGASIGDKWIISTTNPFGFCDDTSRIEVIDTGKMMINSVNYRYIKVQPTSNSPIGLKGTYVERFGNIDTSFYVNSTFLAFQYLFPGPFHCDSLTGIWDYNYFKLKCFEDNSFTLYDPSAQDCEYDLTHLGINKTQGINLEKISPNPFTTSTQITLDKTYHNISLSVYDIQGKLMLQKQYADCDQIQLNRNGLGNGMYFLKLRLDDRWVETGKIVVSE
jgi:hypothetical protein